MARAREWQASAAVSGRAASPSFTTETSVFRRSVRKTGERTLFRLHRLVLAEMPRTGPLVFTTTGTTAISGFSKAKRQLDETLSAPTWACLPCPPGPCTTYAEAW